MDKFFPALFVLLLLAFAAIAAVEACSQPEPMFYKAVQDAAAEAGEGEYYIDRWGYERFRWLDSNNPQ